MPVKRLAIAALAAAASTGAATAEPPLPSGRFQIGGTGIMCVRQPCPTVGVVKLDAGGKPGWPIYSGATPPKIEGDAAAREAVERNWAVGGCVIVEGAFVQPSVLEVARVVGECGGRRARPGA